MAVLGGDLVTAQPHVALDRAHHGARLTAFETDGVDAAVALNREMRFHRDRLLAHENLALGRYCDHRRQQRVSGIKVGDDLRTLLFHNRDEAVGGSEIDAEYTRHK